MGMTKNEITDVGSFISRFQDRPERLLFRGEARDYGKTKLIPTYGRELLNRDLVPKKFIKISNESSVSLSECCDGENLCRAIYTEEYIHKEYWNNLSEILGHGNGKKIWEAQHEGLPTRLLD